MSFQTALTAATASLLERLWACRLMDAWARPWGIEGMARHRTAMLEEMLVVYVPTRVLRRMPPRPLMAGTKIHVEGPHIQRAWDTAYEYFCRHWQEQGSYALYREVLAWHVIRVEEREGRWAVLSRILNGSFVDDPTGAVRSADRLAA